MLVVLFEAPFLEAGSTVRVCQCTYHGRHGIRPPPLASFPLLFPLSTAISPGPTSVLHRENRHGALYTVTILDGTMGRRTC